VHIKRLLAQEVRALLTVHKLPVEKLRDVDNSPRDILRGFGLKVDRVGKAGFAAELRFGCRSGGARGCGPANVAGSRGVA
jgi:transposase